ncbi:sensor domain-containing protein [Arenimonas sp.]|uniref:sensor domain-containing protein n=1 Tax=Arenimonas sp. TaxID=1872635 RepID=UPI0025E49430|nr:sensor domain-containing protein [Arenimonas sp.]
MTAVLPRSIPEYLEQLRAALRGADPALVQDALYDAEEYLRSELAANPGMAEAELIASVASSYGAPEEVADIYRDTEVKVTRALRAPPAPPRASTSGRFFGVASDPRAWTALFYMLLSLATGIVYFTAVVTGASLSGGLALTIIGIPVVILFVGLVRVLSLVEGRIVEVLLGERMPRRPVYASRELPWLERIAAMFTDPRTWSTMLYQLLMLPLGILYFTVAVTLGALSLGLGLGGLAALLQGFGLPMGELEFNDGVINGPGGAAIVMLVGTLLFFVTLHLARGIGRLHGALAKQLLVKTSQQ